MSRVVPRCWRSGSLLALLCSGAAGAAAADVPQFVFEAYPSDVLASKQLYHQNLAAAGSAVPMCSSRRMATRSPVHRNIA